MDKSGFYFRTTLMFPPDTSLLSASPLKRCVSGLLDRGDRLIIKTRKISWQRISWFWWSTGQEGGRSVGPTLIAPMSCFKTRERKRVVVHNEWQPSKLRFYKSSLLSFWVEEFCLFLNHKGSLTLQTWFSEMVKLHTAMKNKVHQLHDLFSNLHTVKSKIN